jgi:hypothetical protein
MTQIAIESNERRQTRAPAASGFAVCGFGATLASDRGLSLDLHSGPDSLDDVEPPCGEQ